ncbi:hypothetical protein HF1_12530 [Mycoplasma haemofelis str. Langford 1]|uniref:Uncharacterized protein n=1 Tax=Mycoplasma haemofelis (strain Langford 1) TaxID=941640 RepID=E8ZJE0_MYCHL|nr:hypothetical protein [Mycoplasma haemofelis]CBY93261.1 hypothetical protein HF1_12530 [Mycoplasma haemofelis str. Langford 1]
MNLINSLILLGSMGSVAAGAYLTQGYWMPSKEEKSKSIRDSLEGKKLISSALSGTPLVKQWEEEFESDKAKIEALLGQGTLDKVKGGVALSTWCSNQMSLDSEQNKGVLENVKSYCLVRSVSNQLKRKSKTLLGTSHTTEWKATYDKRKQASEKRSDVGLTGESNWDEGNDLVKIKVWCSGNSEQEFLVSEQGTSDLYTKVLKWCTKEGE